MSETQRDPRNLQLTVLGLGEAGAIFAAGIAARIGGVRGSSWSAWWPATSSTASAGYTRIDAIAARDPGAAEAAAHRHLGSVIHALQAEGDRYGLRSKLSELNVEYLSYERYADGDDCA